MRGYVEACGCQHTVALKTFLECFKKDLVSITLEIFEDLKRIPPLMTNQPRKVNDLNQVVEKALTDLIEIESSLVIRSIESELPDYLIRETGLDS